MNWADKKVKKFKEKEYTIFLRLQFGAFIFFNCLELTTWFELLCRHDLKGNNNYFELAGGSSYRGLELPRVKGK